MKFDHAGAFQIVSLPSKTTTPDLDLEYTATIQLVVADHDSRAGQQAKGHC